MMMLEILPAIRRMPPAAIDRVRQVEAIAATKPQVSVNVNHFLFAGMYVRTCTIPPRVMITGALVKIPTILVVNGDVLIYIGVEEPKRVTGYHVLTAEANRKQIFVGIEPTELTMLFPSDAKTVKQAEEQFTDEWRLLTTRS